MSLEKLQLQLNQFPVLSMIMEEMVKGRRREREREGEKCYVNLRWTVNALTLPKCAVSSLEADMFIFTMKSSVFAALFLSLFRKL